MSPISRFEIPWIGTIKRDRSACDADFPSYPCAEPESLISTSHPVSFEIGTGASIYTQSLLPAILKAEREVILVTCFWAPSSTLTALRETLEKLAKQRESYIRNQSSYLDGEALPPLDIHICFSSRSVFQKLFHPWSRDGYVYHPSEWASKLGLPDPGLLEAGLINLKVKSLFFLPVSVMHPKFLIIDRQRAWLPSCNVSWESWLEGCVEITGETVATLLRFYRSVWDRHMGVGEQLPVTDDYHQQVRGTWSPGRIGLASIRSPASHRISLQLGAIPTILLPSSHCCNPHFRPFPWQHFPQPPATPLNCAILHLTAIAEKKIYVQTPNLTSAAVVNALLGALDRSIDVTIVTSKGMMILEQLLTSGTTTSWCLRNFIKAYEKRRERLTQHAKANNEQLNGLPDIEALQPKLGSLEISYFHPLPANQEQHVPEEPVHSHLKLMIVDNEYAVLGSGNMDRASWFTSQELGVLFHSDKFVASVNDVVSQALSGRLSLLFDSKH